MTPRQSKNKYSEGVHKGMKDTTPAVKTASTIERYQAAGHLLKRHLDKQYSAGRIPTPGVERLGTQGLVWVRYPKLTYGLGRAWNQYAGTWVTMILGSSDMNYMGCGYGTSEEYETGIRIGQAMGVRFGAKDNDERRGNGYGTRYTASLVRKGEAEVLSAQPAWLFAFAWSSTPALADIGRPARLYEPWPRLVNGILCVRNHRASFPYGILPPSWVVYQNFSP
ncbi:hypothetical protein CVT26_005141 [Gymnopilus dilepis]|uniref:Uncharacterized protein n=1 Tax=Gymnopilus dilepis TaxID=231916 RepID=A0A409X8A7_9AGAR|nr:hypothetical protein CVT26_005141 [Gymnopilus dilepis]